MIQPSKKFLSEIFPSDKNLMIIPDHNFFRGAAVFMIEVAVLALFGLLLALPGESRADIYRFVTVDGVETFTDAPVNRQARVIIREPGKKQIKSGKAAKAEKVHNLSLDEIAAKTVSSAINPQETPSSNIETRLPQVGGTITSGVGMRIDPIDGKFRHHNGIDIAIREGTPVIAVAAGTVVYSGQRSGYGNTVIVEHDNGMLTLYGHNSRLMVSPGQHVELDTVIALSGNTGRSTGPHLHFEAWHAGVNVTPAFMPGSGSRLPATQVASARGNTHFHKEILADGSVLFTNIPSSIP